MNQAGPAMAIGLHAQYKIIALALFAMNSLLAVNADVMSHRYGGHVVAKLPFEPFSLLAKLAHRGLESPAANDCSVVSHSEPSDQAWSA